MSPVVAVIPNDVVGPNMAGPGIRAWEFCRVLSQHVTVRLLIPPLIAAPSAAQMNGRMPSDTIQPQLCHDSAALRRAVADCDIMITRGVILEAYPFLLEMGKRLVLDMYSPVLLEGLQQLAHAESATQLATFERNRSMVTRQLAAADFVLCASEKQRDYWLGWLSAIGRINPLTHNQDHTLRRLIDVVPFGLSAEPPEKTAVVLKGVYPGIAASDRVILWSGGIWNWLDVPTLMRAMALVAQQRDDVKLFFMGTKRPNQTMTSDTAVATAMALSQSLGLTGKSVFFNDWVAYDQRHNYLLEADLGVSLHLDHIETRFAFRTRLLDHIWAGLPTVATQGDVLAERMAQRGLATLVAPGDASALAAAMLAALANGGKGGETAVGFTQLASELTWQRVIVPLVTYCTQAEPAADHAYQPAGGQREASLWQKGWLALRRGGVAGLWREARQYAAWRQRR